MAVRSITSDPKPSSKIPGWFYAYFNKATASGGECACVFPSTLKDVVKRGFTFDDAILRYDESLRASVLELDFGQPEVHGEPQLPPDPELGWADPDGLPPEPPSLPSPAQPAQRFPAPAGTRPPATRRREAAQAAIEGSQLPAAFLKINVQVARSFLLQYALISPVVGEARRADVAQKLCAISSIPYFRQAGVELTDDDVKSINAL
jgi:hypothetical protein